MTTFKDGWKYFWDSFSLPFKAFLGWWLGYCLIILLSRIVFGILWGE